MSVGSNLTGLKLPDRRQRNTWNLIKPEILTCLLILICRQ